MAEQWLSIVEYARTFDVSDMTIRRRIRTGRIKAVLREGKYFIPVSVDHATGEAVRQTAPNRSLTVGHTTHSAKISMGSPALERPRAIPIVQRSEQQTFRGPDLEGESSLVIPQHLGPGPQADAARWQEITTEISHQVAQWGQASPSRIARPA